MSVNSNNQMMTDKPSPQTPNAYPQSYPQIYPQNTQQNYQAPPTAQSGYPQAGYPQPGYSPQPGYPQPGYPQAGYPQGPMYVQQATPYMPGQPMVSTSDQINVQTTCMGCIVVLGILLFIIGLLDLILEFTIFHAYVIIIDDVGLLLIAGGIFYYIYKQIGTLRKALSIGAGILWFVGFAIRGVGMGLSGNNDYIGGMIGLVMARTIILFVSIPVLCNGTGMITTRRRY